MLEKIISVEMYFLFDFIEISRCIPEKNWTSDFSVFFTLCICMKCIQLCITLFYFVFYLLHGKKKKQCSVTLLLLFV